MALGACVPRASTAPLPVVVFLIPLFILMRTLHLVNTHWSLILTYMTFGLPLSIWLLKGFYDNIPEELERSARIDGASRFKAPRRLAETVRALIAQGEG